MTLSHGIKTIVSGIGRTLSGMAAGVAAGLGIYDREICGQSAINQENVLPMPTPMPPSHPYPAAACPVIPPCDHTVGLTQEEFTALLLPRMMFPEFMTSQTPCDPVGGGQDAPAGVDVETKDDGLTVVQREVLNQLTESFRDMNRLLAEMRRHEIA